MQRNIEKHIIFGKQHLARVSLAFLALGILACVDSLEDSTPSVEHANQASTRIQQGPDGVPTDEGCASIAVWVAENAATLPTEYDELARYPVAYRRAIFAALAPAAQSSLWQQHFQAYLAAHPELNPDQRVFVAEMHAVVSPEFFREDQAMATSKERAKSRAAALFPKNELPGLMANLGPVEAPQLGTGLPHCECYTEEQYCGNAYCVSGDCDWQNDGCGNFWVEECDGMCQG
jgi:hypothetical protein